MIRIVSLTWFKIFPPRFGGQRGIALFYRYLSKHLELVCLCSDDNKGMDEPYPVKALLPSGKKQFFLPRTYLTIFKTIKRTACTHLLLEHPYYGWAGIWTKRFLKKKLLVHNHNIEYLRFRQQGQKGWQVLYFLEKLTYRRADLIFFKTAEDKDFAQRKFALPPKKGIVIPYGIEVRPINKAFARNYLTGLYSIDPQKKIVLFASTLDYLPNAQAVELIFKRISPSLDSSLYAVIICGRNKLKGFEYLTYLQADNVIYAGEVNDIELHFAGSDIFINPVMMGGGVQSKILEALSYHLNVVCFEHMLNGLDTSTCLHKLYTTEKGNIDGFIGQIKSAAENNRPTPSAFFEMYSWANIARKAAEAIRQLN